MATKRTRVALNRLIASIEKNCGEREVHRLLKMFPWVAGNVIQNSGCHYLISEFSLGNEFRADFVGLKGFSGGWEIHFIELEPPVEKLFKRDETYAPRLAQALKQVEQWKAFVKQPQKEGYLAEQLAIAVRDNDLLRPQWHGKEPTDSVGWPLTHPKSMKLYYYHIIIGRRSSLTEDGLSGKALFRESSGVELITYDRILDTARNVAENVIYW
jgi:hypothetical protein